MSGKTQHPLRRTKIDKWVNNLSIGDTFRSSDVAKSLNLTPIEAGNALKAMDNVMIHSRKGTKVIWARVEA